MARGAARQVLQETLQHVNIPSFIGDAGGRILWLNDAAKAAFGDRVGDLYTDVVAPEDVARVAAEIEQMRGGAVRSEYEIDAILHDRRRRRVEVSSVPIEGNAIFHGVFGVVMRADSRLSPATDSPLTRRQQDVRPGEAAVGIGGLPGAAPGRCNGGDHSSQRYWRTNEGGRRK